MNLVGETIVTLLVITWTGHCASGKALFNKCMYHHETRVLVTCPANHVIYNLRLLAGKSLDGTCRYQEGDCVGLTASLRQQQKKCQWNRRCYLKWKTGETFVDLDINRNSSGKCLGQSPDYLSVDIPQCYPSDSIIDICNDLKNINIQEGVIRSPRQNLLIASQQSRVCKKYIQAVEHIDVELSLDTFDLGRNVLQIWNVDAEGRRLQVNSERHVSLNVGGQLEIVYTIESAGHGGSDFSMTFSRKSHGASGMLPPYGIELRQTKSASVQECMTMKRKVSSLSCGAGELIYRPRVSAVVSTKGTCRTFRADCEGMTPDIMVQSFRCYWENSCQLVMNGQIPIASSDNWQCIGKRTSFSSVKRHTCIKQDQVFDICDDSETAISQSEGFIRSHSSYPWNYDTQASECRRRFEIDNNQTLVITADEIDLDPEGTDVITVFHTLAGSRKPVYTSSTTLDPKLSLRGGTVEVVFTVLEDSKSGRGFVLLFQKHTLLQESDNNSVSVSGNGKQRIVSGVKRRRLNRRKQKGRRKQKKQKRKRKNKKRKGGKGIRSL
ncbi:hypothetical protein ScPMuIL_010026 [Solemya velum]